MRLFLTLMFSVLFVQQVMAKPARCFTTDDGYYNCNFRAIEGNGSFIITAPGIPAFTLQISEPGVGYGFARFNGGRNINLPGAYIRSRKDRACWLNDATGTKVCVW